MLTFVLVITGPHGIHATVQAQDSRPTPYTLEYTYQRPSQAYFGDCHQMYAYDPDVPIYRTTVACRVSDGEIRSDQSGIVPHCRNSSYLFGQRADGMLFRSTDGHDWISLGWGANGWMFALADDSLIRTHHADGDMTVSRSTDDGVTWQRACWADTGEDFAWLTTNASQYPFGVLQAANGTIIMVEYKLPTGGRYIYRSDTSGATWRMVHDAGVGIIKHFHAVTKHEGLGRWIVSTGDDTPQHKLLASDDDGLTWYDYTALGQLYMQPTFLLDYGHPSRLLFGSDLTWRVGWVDISDGPEARSLASLITNWDSEPGRDHCFNIFEHNGLYYASSYDHTGDGRENAVISVSADLQHWVIYHRFLLNEFGVLKFAGEIGGRLHLVVSNIGQCEQGGCFKHLAISPVELVAHQALVIAPPTENLFDSLDLSSAESTADWVNDSPEVPPGSGAQGVLEYVDYTAHHGAGCLHYTRSDGGHMRLLSPAIPFEAGKTYQARLWIKGAGAESSLYWVRNSANYARVRARLWRNGWREMMTAPFTVPTDTTELRIMMTLYSTSDNTCEAHIDSLQVEEVPSTHWQVGGLARAGASLEAVTEVPDEWTNVFTIEPDVMSTYLAAVGESHIRRYVWECGASLELYFDGQDARFKLRPTVAGIAGTPIATSPQFFLRQAHVRLAVRSRYDELGLAIGNGQPIESVISDTYLGPGPDTLTISNGAAMYGRGVLPHALFNDVMFDAYIPLEQLPDVMNDLGTSRQNKTSRPKRGSRPASAAMEPTAPLSPGSRADNHTSTIHSDTFLALSAPCQGHEQARLNPATARWFNHAGRSVAIAGDVAVIGAPGHAGGSVRSGSASVFRRDGDGWIEEAQLTDVEAKPYDYFGIAVAVSGDVVVIGAPGSDDAGERSGAVSVYRHDSGNWIEQAHLTAPDAAPGDEFGRSVAVNNDVIVVGARYSDAHGEDSGAAYIYHYDQGDWLIHTILAAPYPDAGDQYGCAVAVDGDVAVIGARFAEGGDKRSGAAYIYRYDTFDWSLEATLTAPDAAPDDAFGCAVDIADDVVLIGAYGEDEGGTDRGAAYVFIDDGQDWIAETRLTPTDAATNSYFGYAVAVSGDLALIGAFGDAHAGHDSGAAYVFHHVGKTWTTEARFSASDAAAYQYFGAAVAIDGDVALLGAYRDDDDGYGSGSVCVCLGLDDCNENQVLDYCDMLDGTSPDCNVNVVPDECDIAQGTSPDDNANGIPDECELLGDMNCDGCVNAYDIDGFICALSPDCDYEQLYPHCLRQLADCNGDGAVNSYDIDAFIVLIGSG
ncbi:MAG: hypothetical protein ABIG44_02490 [Planctomycetota bacterium]